MALIKCGKCGELISDKAKKCPYCEKNRELFSENIRILLYVYAISSIIIVVFVLCSILLP